jgi:hypothetical protein
MKRTQQALLQHGFLQRGFDFMSVNKWKQLFAERGKFNYTHSAKQAVITYGKYHYFRKS